MKIDKHDEVTILFGIFYNNPGNCLLNHLIILGKYTIYLCRCKNIKPSLSLLRRPKQTQKQLQKRIKRLYSLQKMAKHVMVTFLFLIAKYRVYSCI